MKKIVIVLLILIVIGTVGFYSYNEFKVREIVYVGDYEYLEQRNKHTVKRLYSSDVDFDEYNRRLEDLISLEFTEEEILKAALESGEPEFYPSFYTNVYRQSIEDEIFSLHTIIIQELASGQEHTNFRMANLRLEVITNNVTIEKVNAESQNVLGEIKKEVPLVNEAKTGMTVELENYGNTEIVFKGTEGNIVLQYVYDIENTSIVTTEVMSDCFIRINVKIGEGEDGKITAEYSIDPSSTVEEYIDDQSPAET